MLVLFKLAHLLVITFCFHVSYGQRRIVGMNFTTVEKRYMVYLVQSKQSRPRYDAWLCGGALVRTNKILTSAACLIESSNIYAIAGYKTYISTADLDKNNCTKTMKRRVIKICVPQGYDFDPSNTTIWMTLDIGVAVVDRPYRSSDELFRLICHYAPKPIPVLYHSDLTYEGQDVLAYGWGFKRGRRPGDPGDYNSKRLKYAPYRLANGSECKNVFNGSGGIIDKYMLCARSSGFMDDDGRLMLFDYKTQCRRRGGSDFTDNSKDCSDSNTAGVEKTHMVDARRQVVFNLNVSWGICQNDHGGPLVAYIGVTEQLIGIAVNTVYDDSYNCIGPSLYTSTACTSNIIICMLTDNPVTRRAYTNVVKREGFEIHERNVVWEEESSDEADRDMNSESDETMSHPTVSPQDKGIGNKRTL